MTSEYLLSKYKSMNTDSEKFDFLVELSNILFDDNKYSDTNKKEIHDILETLYSHCE